MKYFYYISKAKVEMLSTQIRRPEFSLASLTSKIGIGAASVSVTAEKQTRSIVEDTLDLLKCLEKQKLVKSSDELPRLETGCFYHDEGKWKSGLFSFDSMCDQPTVIYVLWRVLKGSLVLLVGSPNNILGEKVVAGDCFIPGTSGAHLEILKFISEELQCDERIGVRTKGPRRFDIPVLDNSNSSIAPLQDPNSAATRFRNFESPPDFSGHHLRVFSEDQGRNLAWFCLTHLAALPEMHSETLFRVFSNHPIRAVDRDGEKERLTLYRQGLLEKAENIGLFDFERIYIGSPVYTAL